MLFAAENDHNAVEKLAELLEGKVQVISCMVDRICSTREVVPGAIKVRRCSISSNHHESHAFLCLGLLL